jgi:hypothetical protein
VIETSGKELDMKKLSISKAWDEASAFLRREARLVAPIALALFALPNIIAGWIAPANAAAGGDNGRLLLVLLVLIAAIIGQMAIAALAIGWRGRLGEAIALATRRVWVVLVAAFMIFMPLVLIMSIAIAAAAMSAGLADPAQLTPQALAKVPSVGLMVFIGVALMIIVAVKLFPMAAVAVNESTGPVALIRRTWGLTSGHFWRLLAVMLLLLVATLILSGALTAIVGLVATLAFGEARPFSVTALIAALASGVASALVTSVSATMIGRIYAQLVHQPTVPEVHQEKN